MPQPLERCFPACHSTPPVHSIARKAAFPLGVCGLVIKCFTDEWASEFFPLSECQSTISFSHTDFFLRCCKLAQHFHRVLHRFSIASVNEFSIATLDDWTLKRWRRKWNFWWRLISVVKLTARKEFILHKLELTTVGERNRSSHLLCACTANEVILSLHDSFHYCNVFFTFLLRRQLGCCCLIRTLFSHFRVGKM